MKILKFTITHILIICCWCYTDEDSFKWPTIGVSITVRNKAHTLPYFFSCLQNLDYPKDRIYVWIHIDFNEDGSVEIVDKWLKIYASQYNRVQITNNTSMNTVDSDAMLLKDWSVEHLRHIIQIREEALNFARKMWADYIFMLDADVFLTDPLTLKYLVSKDQPVVAPMLKSDGLYSNFWCGMTEDYYYKRTDDYKIILNRKEKGCFQVVMVHTAVLISLREKVSDLLTYVPEKLENYDGPVDDIITFAISASSNGIPLSICNEHAYGFIPMPLGEGEDSKKDYDQIVNVKLEAISKGNPLPLLPHFEPYVTYPEKSKYGCDEIYMINLERRVERKKLMELSFKELGLDVTTVKAFDGRDLDLNHLNEFGITLMPNYEDPYFMRPMKAGEIGCFLSHYYLWKQIVAKQLNITLILEDDIHFTSHFRFKFARLLSEIRNLDWDLVYIGRKILQDSEEQYVTPHTTSPLYSYWTLGYLLSQKGAQKLLDVKPLTKLLPVDEYLPIMFDQHPNDTWKTYFPNRNLYALSAAPLLISPTHYTGEEGYVSDTENSEIIDTTILQNNKIEL